MKKQIILVLGVALALVGCAQVQGLLSGSPTVVAATVSADVLPAGDLQIVQGLCNASSGILELATRPSVPSAISGAAIFFQSYCQQLASAPAGTVPATTTSGTKSWLQLGLAALRGALTLAGML